MFCPACGCELPDDAVFCKKCGKRIPQRQNINTNTVPNDSVKPVVVITEQSAYEKEQEIIKQRRQAAREAREAHLREQELRDAEEQKKQEELKAVELFRQQEELKHLEELRKEQDRLIEDNKKKQEELQRQAAEFQKKADDLAKQASTITGTFVKSYTTYERDTEPYWMSEQRRVIEEESKRNNEDALRRQETELREEKLRREAEEARRQLEFEREERLKRETEAAEAAQIQELKRQQEAEKKKKTIKTVAWIVGIIIGVILVACLANGIVSFDVNYKFNSTPSGASVYVDDVYKGTTPLTIKLTPFKKYSVKISKSGYTTKLYTVTPGTRNNKLEVALSANTVQTIASTASLTVSSNVTGASVYINGTYRGLTPLTVSLSASTFYSVKVTKSGYVSKTQTVTMGTTSRVVYFDLQKETQTVDPSVTTEKPTTSDETYNLKFKWSYNGYDFAYTARIYKDFYKYYKSLGHSNTNLAKYATDKENRELVKQIADSITSETTRIGFTDYQKVMTVVAFVQALPYTTDSASTGSDEYVRYPVETLVDGGGDCEDSAILTAALLREMGYGVVLINPPGHVAVGVKGGEGIYGTYWTYEDEKYYYLETTGKNWDVGEIPDKYKNSKAKVIYIA